MEGHYLFDCFKFIISYANTFMYSAAELKMKNHTSSSHLLTPNGCYGFVLLFSILISIVHFFWITENNTQHKWKMLILLGLSHATN